MKLKRFKPITPSRRQMASLSYKDVLTKQRSAKKLTFGFHRAKGRNAFGRITTRHKGGGAKRLFREVDFKYNKRNIPATVKSVEYDPNRSGLICLIAYKDGEKRYVLASSDMKIGDEVVTSESAELKTGNKTTLERMPVGSQIFNIELKPNAGARLCRSAGNYAEVLAHEAGFSHLKLPSGEIRKVSDRAWATIGRVSKEEHNLIVLGKAGRSRWRGIRPTVRGSAMNPVDHPYGGGEGRAGQGTRRPKNLWGKGTRGVKTRKVKKYSRVFIVSRRKKK